MELSKASTRSRFFALALGLGIAALFAAQLTALLNHRLDYPLIDDWRYYRDAFAMPAELSLEWLFAPARDTLHLSGKLLDWLVLRWVRHDYAVLAAASFVLAFGGWLVAAVGACLAASRGMPGVRNAALLTFALPLAACPYFVTAGPLQKLEPAIAYHQMLPVLGLSALAWMALSRRDLSDVSLALAVLVTFFFGLTYSSGAVALFLFGATLLLLTWLRRGHPESQAFALALGVSAAATISLVLHVAIPAAVHGANPVVEARTYEMTSPFEWKYWDFLFALFDRAVLSTATGTIPRLRGVTVALAVTAPFAGLAALLLRGRLDPETARRALPLLATFVAIIGYAALVSYGRADFGRRYLPPHDLEARPSLYAHNRFFFWWITASLPGVVVAWGLFVTRVATARTARIVVWSLAVLALLPKPAADDGSYLDHWRYAAAYREDARRVETQVERNRHNARRRQESAVAAGEGATFVERWGLDVHEPGALR